MKPNIPAYIGVMPEHEDMKYLLHEDALTQGFGILAQRRMGKSNLAGVIMEIMLLMRDQIIVIDPPGAHVGIRNLADPKTGQPAGPSNLNILIVGGENADIRLDPQGGRALAQVLMETKMSCVINLKGTRMRERKDFLTDFGEELYAHNKTPLHVFLEEADETIPQQPDNREEQAIRHIWRQLIKGGGQQGIGFTIITQRPAMVDKTSLYQVDNLFVMGLLGAGDVDTLEKWFKHNTASDEERKAILRSLSDLQPGEAWLLSPKWLKAMVRINVRPRATYHAGRTPKRGETPTVMERYSLGDVVAKVQGLMEAKGVEAALPEERANKAQAALLEQDLRLTELRAKLQEAQELNAELGSEADLLRRQRDVHVCAAPVDQELISEVIGKVAALQTKASELSDDLGAVNFKVRDLRESTKPQDPAFAEAVRRPEQVSQRAYREPLPDFPPLRLYDGRITTDKAAPPEKPVRPAANGEAKVGTLHRQIASILAGHFPKPMRRSILAALLGRTDGGSFGARLSEVRNLGLIEDLGGGEVRATNEALKFRGEYRVPRTTAEVLNLWDQRLSQVHKDILNFLVRHRGNPVSRAEVARAVGKTDGGSFGARLSEIRAKGLITDAGKGMIAANKETLFL